MYLFQLFHYIFTLNERTIQNLRNYHRLNQHLRLNSTFYMRKLLILFLLATTAAFGQAPTNSSTQITGSTAFTPNGWRYKDSTQVQAYNTTLGKFFQVVTGKQFNNYIGTATQAALNNTYTKAHIDSAINNASTQTYYASLSSGNTLTASAIQNAVIIGVTRSGPEYYSTASTSPLGNFYYYNTSAGSIKFQDSFSASGESVLVKYKAVNTTINGVSGIILTYATMAAISYPISQNSFIVVNANEDQDGARWMFFAPAGTSAKTQLQAIASTPYNF